MADAAGRIAPLFQQQPPMPCSGIRLRVREITEADHEGVARLLAKGFQRPVWYYELALERL